MTPHELPILRIYDSSTLLVHPLPAPHIPVTQNTSAYPLLSEASRFQLCRTRLPAVVCTCGRYLIEQWPPLP
jgi:hypothetical protein